MIIGLISSVVSNIFRYGFSYALWKELSTETTTEVKE